MVFQLDIDVYFWMVDRADLSDDQKNQVNMQKQKVDLHKDHSAKMENGVYIGKLMHAIRKTVIKKTKKPFTLDPALANLKDQSTKSVKEHNWNLIVSELKKFNIKVNKEKKQQIIEEKSQGAINDILAKLKDYDGNIIPTVQQQASNMVDDGYRVPEYKPEINSEINYGGYRGGDFIERKPGNNADADSQRLNNNVGVALSNTKSTAILLQAPTKKQTLDPLELVGNRNQQSVPQLNPSLNLRNRRANESFDLNLSADINPDDVHESPGGLTDPAKITDLRTAQNSVMFIFASLKQALEMRHNQVGGLLANQYKFLVHICVKGMKGADYSKIIEWYKLLFINAEQLVLLLSNENNDQIKPTFDVIKCGLFSKNAEVSVLCSRLFLKIVQILNAHQDQGNILDLKFVFYEWLTLPRMAPRPAPSGTPSPMRGKNGKPPKRQEKNDSADSFMYEQGLKAFMRAYKRGNKEFNESFAIFLINVGQDNLVDLITNHLRIACESTLQFLEVITDIQDTFFNSQEYKQQVLDSGVMNVLVDMLIQIADTQQTLNQFGDSTTMEAIAQQNNEKQRSLMLLVDFWKSNPQIIQSQENEGRTTDAIMQVLKKGTRDRSKALSILSMNLMFSLLDSFATDRNRHAPVLYKALTFIMVDSYGNLELREEMYHNFINVFTNIPSMPIQILCEPLFKQIQINLEKQESDPAREQNNILNPASNYFNLNTTDMNFFMHIAIHPRLHANTAVQLLRIVTEISRKNIIFTRISLKLILTILNRFENNTTVFEFCQGQIRTVMKIIYDQDGIKTDLYHLLIRDPKNRVFLQKKKAQDKSLAAQLEGNKAEFSNVVSKNSINFKLSMSPGKDHLQKTKGITAGNSMVSQGDFIDDSDVQQVLNPANFQEESSQYLSLRTLEKMIVNQLQCFINTGIKVLVDYIRQQLIETYIKIEKKFKFKNKGLLYLLALYEKDVTKMLQYYYGEQTKAQKEKIRAKKEQREKELEEKRRLEAGSDDLDLDESHHFSLEDLNDRKEATSFDLSVKKSSLRKPKFSVQETPKPKNKIVSKQVSKIAQNRNSVNIMTPGDVGLHDVGLAEQSTDKAYGNFLATPDADNRAKSTSVKSLRSGSGNKRSLGEPVGVRALSVGRAKDQIVLFDILATNDYEVQKYVVWMKEHLKLYKAMFHKYATVSSSKINIRKVTFDDIKDQQNTMSLTDVFSFLNDFKILQTYGKNSENIRKLTRDDIKSIIKMINLKNAATVRTQADLDITGFIEFVLQLGHFTHDRSQKASLFLPSLFAHLKEVSLNSKQPLFQRLFQDPTATSIGNTELIRELTNKVNQDPDYPLPPGYIKFRQNKVLERYEAPPYVEYESEKISMEVLDDIMNQAIGVHFLQPEVDNVQMWGVKPDIFQQNLKKQAKASYAKIGEKHSFNPNNIGSRNEPVGGVSQSLTTPSNKASRSLGLKRDFAVNSSVDLGLQRRRPPASTKRKATTKESTLEPEIGVELKIQLARNNNRPEIKEAAIIMEDMIRALELQPDGRLSIRNLHKTYESLENTAAKRGTRTQNRYQKAKAEAARLEQEEATRKAEEKRLRDEKLKKKLQAFQKEKQQRFLQEKQQRQEDQRKKRQAEERKAEKKKALYDKIKEEHEEVRLPQIQEQKEREREKKRQEREIVKQKREEANEKTQLRIQALMRDFSQKKQVKIKEEEESKKKEEDARQKQRDKRDKVAKNRVSIAQRQEKQLENDRKTRAERSQNTDNIPHSPDRAQGNRVRSSSKPKVPSRSASTKSPQRNASVRQSSNPNMTTQDKPNGRAAQQQQEQLGNTGNYDNEEFYDASQVFNQDPQQADQRSPPKQRVPSEEPKAQAKNFWGRLGIGSNK